MAKARLQDQFQQPVSQTVVSPAAAPLVPPKYSDPWSSMWNDPATAQAALYNADPTRPRPAASPVVLAPPTGETTDGNATLTDDGQIRTDWK